MIVLCCTACSELVYYSNTKHHHRLVLAALPSTTTRPPVRTHDNYGRFTDDLSVTLFIGDYKVSSFIIIIPIQLVGKVQEQCSLKYVMSEDFCSKESLNKQESKNIIIGIFYIPVYIIYNTYRDNLGGESSCYSGQFLGASVMWHCLIITII